VSVVVEEVRFDAPAARKLLAEWQDELAITIPGFSPVVGSSVEAPAFEPPEGVFLLASSDDVWLGCAGLRRLTEGVGEVKRLFVRPAARGQGVARALLEGLEQRAAGQGLEAIRLDTHGGEPSAVGLFRAAGYLPIADYNANPYAKHWFEKRLAGSCP
jgi:GNAT superfamily N-acetyltransferase